jgi:hypothetical protein
MIYEDFSALRGLSGIGSLWSGQLRPPFHGGNTMRIVMALALMALVAATGTASAKTKTTMISLDGDCDVLTVNVAKPQVYGTDLAQCGGAYGAGLIGSVKGSGDSAIVGVQSAEEPGVQLVFQLQYPFKTGGAWTLYETTDGTSMTELENGTYTVENGAIGNRPAHSVFAVAKPQQH